MSLNQIIDQVPLSSLVVDNTLKLKARSLRVKDSITADTILAQHYLVDPASSDNLDMAYTLYLWDGSTNQPVVGTTGTSGIIKFRKIGQHCVVQFPFFNVTDAAVTGTGTFRLVFASTLNVKFRPVGGNLAVPVRGKSNNANLTTPALCEYDSQTNAHFEIFSNYARANFVTGITGSTNIPAGTVSDVNVCYHCP